MNIKSAITMTVAALSVLSASAAMADKIGSVSTPTPNTVIFTSSGAGGTTDSLNVTYADGTWSPNAGHGTAVTPVKFTLSATGGSSTSLGGGNLLESFQGGAFSITSGSTDLLSGTFTGGSLTTFNPSLGVSTATYDLASTSLGTDGTIGSFSLEFNFDPGSGYVTTGGYLHSFTASDSATFNGVPTTTVPEPATVAPFALGGLGLLALALRARKTRRTVAAA